MDAATLFDGIRAGDQHKGGFRCLQLYRLQAPFFAEIRSEVERMCGAEPASEVSRPDHVTHWVRPFGDVLQFSLLNRSGRTEDYADDHDVSCLGKGFRQAEAYPALARLIGALPHTINFRLNLLAPGAGLSPHEEHVLMRTRSGTVGARLRFHLPVVTNRGAEMMLDGNVYHLEPGVLYFVNHGCVHDAKNGGDQPRAHLVWDMLLTRAAFGGMFAGAAARSAPLDPIDAAELEPRPLRTGHPGAYRRLPPAISAAESTKLDFCDVQ